MKTPRSDKAWKAYKHSGNAQHIRSESCRLETELAEMRKAMSRVVNNIGNGSFAADDASHEWMTKEAPEEVRLYCNRLRRELAAAKAAHQKADEQWITRENELMTDSARWKHLWQEVAKELADAQSDIAEEIKQSQIYKSKLEAAERNSGIYCSTLKLSAQKLRCDEHMVDHAVSDLIAKLAERTEERDEARFKFDQEVWRNHPEAVETLVKERDIALAKLEKCRTALEIAIDELKSYGWSERDDFYKKALEETK